MYALPCCRYARGKCRVIFEVRALIYVGMFGDADVAAVAVARLAHVYASQACVQRWTLDKHCQ